MKLSLSTKKTIRILLCKSYFHHILRKKFKHKVIIIMYHNFNESKNNAHKNVCLNINSFEKQIKYLKKYYNVISLEKLIDYIKSKQKIPNYSVVITFDDGYMNNYTLAYPLLKKYNVHASIFLTVNNIKNDTWLWVNKLEYIISTTEKTSIDINIPDTGTLHLNLQDTSKKKDAYHTLKELLKNLHPKELKRLLIQIQKKFEVEIDYKVIDNYKMLNFQVIKKMSPRLVDFGSHTLTHPILTKLTHAEYKNEIINSKTTLEKILNRKVKFFCYPNGNYNQEIIEIVSKHYTAAVSTEGDFINPHTNLFTLNRVSARADFDHFKWSLVHPTT